MCFRNLNRYLTRLPLPSASSSRAGKFELVGKLSPGSGIRESLKDLGGSGRLAGPPGLRNFLSGRPSFGIMDFTMWDFDVSHQISCIIYFLEYFWLWFVFVLLFHSIIWGRLPKMSMYEWVVGWVGSAGGLTTTA